MTPMCPPPSDPTKRGRDSPQGSVDGRERKRAKSDERADGPSENETAAIHRRLEARYGLDMDRAQFVGLCGYLCVILRWGYRMEEDRMDDFIQHYPAYVAAIPRFEQYHIANPRSGIPSYHHWVVQHHGQDRSPDTQPVLDDAALRAIWRENPYQFLRAELSLDYLVEQGGAGRGPL